MTDGVDQRVPADAHQIKNARTNGPTAGPATTETARRDESAPPRSPDASAERLTEDDMRRFRERISDPANKNLSDDVQAELAAVMDVAARIQQSRLDIPGIAAQIKSIIDCLLTETPRLVFARAERARLQSALYSRLPWPISVLAAGNSISVVFVAPIVSLIAWGLLLFAVQGLYSKIPMAQDAFFMNSQALVVMTSAAFVGGVISIAMRWREFAQVRDVYPFARFVTVMFKPLIGVGLSVFILAALESRVVTLAIFDNNGFTAIDSAEFKTYYKESVAAALGGQTTPSATTAASATLDAATKTAGYKTLYLLWVLGFLAGFSERFAGDFVDRTASIAGGKEDAAKNRPS